MKSKKIKILAPLLSIGALTTILVPTITLTSCSATATPYLQSFSSNGSNLTYSLNNVQGTKTLFTFNTKLDQMGNMFETQVISSNPSLTIGTDYFAEEWKKIIQKDTTLPDSIYKLDKDISNSVAAQDIKNAIKNQNILTLFVSVINNMKSVLTNYSSLFIAKNPEIATLIKNSDFVKYFAQGLNNYKSYARLWLSDIKFDVELSVSDEGIGKEFAETETKKQVVVKLQNIEWTYKWYLLNDDGSTEITTLNELQEFGSELKELKYKFTSQLATDVYFNEHFNLINNKYYKTGLIVPDSLKPLAFNFQNTPDANNREKTDFFNNEVLWLVSKKMVENWELNNLYGKVGYLLTKVNFDSSKGVPETEYTKSTNIKNGQNWIHDNLFGWLVKA